MTISQTTLAKSPHLYDQTISLIEKSFNYTKEYSFESDFYPLMQPNNHEHNHILIKDEQVIAHIGICLKELNKKNISTKVALIGGVAVSEDFRGMGVFKELFNDVINIYSKDIALFLLWSDKSQLYQKYNFYEFGSIFQTGPKQPDPEFFNSIGFFKEKLSSLPSRDIGQLSTLYDKAYKNFVSPSRGDRDWENYSNITSTDLYIKRDAGKSIKEYFFINKGFDLNGVIHECSFINDDHLIDEFSSYMLWTPNRNNLKSINKTIYTALVKISNEELFKVFIHEIFSQDIHINYIKTEYIDFNFKGSNYSISSIEFITMIFGPNPAREFEEYSASIYIPGLDSI